MNLNTTWELPRKWITPRRLLSKTHKPLGTILRTLATAKVRISFRSNLLFIGKKYKLILLLKILKADVLHKGSQLKLLLTLEGNQKAVLKPGRFERDYVIPGNGNGFINHFLST